MKRRTFLRGSLAGAALLSLSPALSKREVEASLSVPESKGKKEAANSTIKTPVAEDVFHLGMAGYTFNKFDLDTTLSFMKRIDVHYLCIKDFHLSLDADAEQIAAFKAKLAAANVIGYAVGPIYMKDVAAVDKAFAYAQRVGVDLIVGVPGTWGDTTPNHDVLDRVEQKSVRQTSAMRFICTVLICRSIPMPLPFGRMSRTVIPVSACVWTLVITCVTVATRYAI